MDAEVKPKKILGQYFLKNTSAVMQSINALRLKTGETVIEIGPGMGALTIPLSKHCRQTGCNLIAVEKDSELAGRLRLAAEGATDYEILTGDILTELPKLSKRLKEYKLIGNIPYYITGILLRTISELEYKPKVTVLMIQKEVAQRICAGQGEMNLLGAATQIWAEPKLVLTLKPHDFEPAPAVDSAVIELITKKGQPEIKTLTNYYAVAHRIFKQPRKTLLNNLISPSLIPSTTPIPKELAQKMLAKLQLNPAARPQDLTIEQISTLAEMSAKLLTK